MSSRYTLETYKGRESRSICPSCGRAGEFVRYVDVETGDHLADNVGRCNREVECRYHYKPREFLKDNPALRPQKDASIAHVKRNPPIPVKAKNRIDLIPFEVVRATLTKLTNFEGNAFVQFLSSHYSVEEVQHAVARYLIGTWMDGRTVFWQIDTQRLIRTGKLMAYDPQTGKRRKDVPPSWVHSQFKRYRDLPGSFKLEQCLFGEHLLSLTHASKVVGIVESEKTAVVASVVMPDYVWLSTGGSNNLHLERQRLVLRDRRVVLFPDSSKFEKWSLEAVEARRSTGLNVRVSDYLERRLTEEEKRKDYDIADLLLAHKKVG